jgi:hypothetical protein
MWSLFDWSLSKNLNAGPHDYNDRDYSQASILLRFTDASVSPLTHPDIDTLPRIMTLKKERKKKK